MVSERDSMNGMDIVCLSHLRWGFVHQRPQHLLSRFARRHRVFFVEEPVFDARTTHVEYSDPMPNVTVVTLHLRPGSSEAAIVAEQAAAIDGLVADHGIDRYLLWYYTPMAVEWTRHLRPAVTVYDCMDELSGFAGAPSTLLDREGELLDSADLVFTGGMSLYEAKRRRHPHVHPFPSGVDVGHFAPARLGGEDPEDQLAIPHPRVGYFGVIDERLDRELLAGVAALRPDVQFVMIGPVVKISSDDLPRADNIHYLGQKEYSDLPRYVRGWDVAMLPFARNDATRFVSPTKTPEYLAAGLPTVSTSIQDVVRPYGEMGLVEIADTPEAFSRSIDRVLVADRQDLLVRADEMLAGMSWDDTSARMRALIAESAGGRPRAAGPGDGAGAATLLDLTGDGAVTHTAVRRNGEQLVTVGPERGFDWLIVGAGFAGAVLAERLATQTDARVLIVDRRPHVGGNAYDEYDADGILVHRYGPHIFHTNSERVFDYLSSFTSWRSYQHRVLASVDGQLVPIPINLETVNRLYGMSLTTSEAEAFFDEIREPIAQPRTSEDVVVSAVGRELYEKFFRGYTRKQWGLDPSELDASVTSRVPTRTSRDDRYFTDTFQAMPLHGYTAMFRRILDHPNIKVMLNTDYREVADFIPYREMIYTGPIDEFFDHACGTLPYRSLEFVFETHDVDVFQPAPVVNHPNDYAYTRVTEFKYLTGQEHRKTSLVYEYPRAEGDPYYPVPRPENGRIYERYRELARRTPGVHFVGRLATYRYYNMDQVVAQALAVFERLRAVDRDGKEGRDGTDGAIVSPHRALGRDRVHAQPGRRALVRPA
jgi:UDP-galactopyranose mutase